MDIFELMDIGENSEIEFKKAKNSVPKDLWETYSAMANTNGGTIVLGVEERLGEAERFCVSGINSVEKVLKDFWDTINGSKVNKNILMDRDVEIIDIDSKKVIRIEVPRANYSDKPIFLNGNPYNGTYKRNYEGDYKCSVSEVNAMIRDSSDDNYDSVTIENYDINDLDMETVHRYRNAFSSRNLHHIWIKLSDEDFLMQLGAIARDRNTQKVWVTVAGLLMFGKGLSIREKFPYLNLDYLNMIDSDTDFRYGDRVTIDGNWENNLFNFYMKVINKLVEGLPIPFRLEGIVRVDDTPVNRALREALVNTLIHGNYSIEGTIKIMKFKNRFEFHNPGNLRIPVSDVYSGGISKCRNKNLQKMFRLIGFGENIGSGFPKILKAWYDQKWAEPILEENFRINEVVLKMSMISFVPEVYREKLKLMYGNGLDSLNTDEVKILLAAITEGEISNARVQCILDMHSKDISDLLRSMVNRGLLVEEGFGRGKKYMANEEFCWEKEELSIEEDLKEESKTNNLDRRIKSIDDLNLLNVKLNKVEEDILKIIINDGSTTANIIMKNLGLSKYKSIKSLNDLIEKELIKRIGVSRNTKYVLNYD
ncbi:RNA-binding domain-containing protein [Peptacetobacter sp.]|uniref:RNA-binding domain-containing protein n=1 Tax=Peptacetobacter sp. TaxID=2991975 RepID=UPI002E799E1F|nr:RNA-binding domain-containing protein [Peptacetobacter sp.]MEE0451527.1 putative DNA binding domain-containing protein [Peptacetobacter sp.]